MDDSNGFLSGRFLQAVLRDSKYVGLALAVGGAVVTRDYRFVIALGLGSVVDILSLAWIVEHRRAAPPDLTRAVLGVSVFRILIKSVLIVGAALLGNAAVFWGTILGVLVVEITLMTVGVIESIRTVTSI
ncbi:MAG: hypothetical protein C4521_07155 [Actinobacteria bacterium]|jgi:hypothetical protein|nr:MAG: hypothetical protein C4521_07155 [Actinomycetota bacterium]